MKRTIQNTRTYLWICGSRMPWWCSRSVKCDTSHQFLNSELRNKYRHMNR